MPCDNRSQNNVDDTYLECVNDIDIMSNQYNPDMIIFGGDLNTDIDRNNAHSTFLKQFCLQSRLKFAWDSELAATGPTYLDSLLHSSVIDHFICSQNVYSKISSLIIVDDPINESNHRPIVLSLAIDNIPKVKVNTKCMKTRVQWEKVQSHDVEKYQIQLNKCLQDITLPTEMIYCNDFMCTNVNHRKNIDDLCNIITDICVDCGEKNFPCSRNKSHNTVAYWKDLVKPFHDNALFWHDIWVQCGRPRDGAVANIRRLTRARYHKEVRMVKKNNEALRKQRMCELISDNRSRELWQEVKKLKPRNNLLSSIVNGYSEDSDIADCFRSKYNNLYNSVPTEASCIESVKNCILNRIELCSDVTSVITPFDVIKAVKSLNPGKGDGFKGLSSSHIIYGTNRLYVLLAFLLQSIVVHGYVPSTMLRSIIVSIPKDPRQSLTTTDNYRGISLCSCFCKILDLIIINKCESCLKSSDLQFAFKKDHSTIMCTSVLKQIVSLYNCKGSAVYACMVDASKAFDKIHFGKLFNLLLKRGMPASIVRVLLNQYENQTICTNWNGVCSDDFHITNGVRQGGVLSPLLFTVYLDELIDRLKQKGIGCYVGYHYVGAIAYADDLTLLSPSRSGLQSMLSVCESYGKEFFVSFNSSKTNCIVFNKKFDPNVPKLFLSNQELDWNDRVNHLGNIITYHCNDISDISAKRGTFIAAVNNLLANFNTVPLYLLNTLFKNYCCSFYGCQTWNLREKYLQNLSTIYNKSIRRIWHLPYNSHTRIVHEISGSLSIDVLLAIRFVNMFSKMASSSNPCIHFIAMSALDNVVSFLGANFIYICVNFDIFSNDKKLWNIKCTKHKSLNGLYLNDLIACRNGLLVIKEFDSCTVNDLIEYWSTTDIVYI